MEEKFISIDVSSTDSMLLNLSENAVLMSLQSAISGVDIDYYHRYSSSLSKTVTDNGYLDLIISEIRRVS